MVSSFRMELTAGRALAGVLTLFVVLALWNWHLPGVYYDEVILTSQAFRVDGAAPAMFPKFHKAWDILLGVERMEKITRMTPLLPSLTLLLLILALFCSPWNDNRKWVWGCTASLVLLLMCSVVPGASGTNARHFVLLFPCIPLLIIAAWSGSVSSGTTSRRIDRFHFGR